MRRIVLATLLVFPALSQDAGKRQFEARCAGCHGADGNGGGHGRAITGSQRDRDGIREVILKGMPAAGMPAFADPSGRSGGDRGLRDLVAAGDRRDRGRRCRARQARLRGSRLRLLPHDPRTRRHRRSRAYDGGATARPRKSSRHSAIPAACGRMPP